MVFKLSSVLLSLNLFFFKMIDKNMCVLGFFKIFFLFLLLLFFYASKRVDNSFFRYYIKVFKFRIYKGSAEVRVSVVTHFVRLPASQGSQ